VALLVVDFISHKWLLNYLILNCLIDLGPSELSTAHQLSALFISCIFQLTELLELERRAICDAELLKGLEPPQRAPNPGMHELVL
jgi:hypothetical protein